VTQWFAGRYSSAPTLLLDGEWEVPEVVQGAWQGPDGTVGLVFVAVGVERVAATIEIDGRALWDIDLAGAPVRISTSDGPLATASCDGDGIAELEIVLEPRVVTLVEIEPNAD
jgi:hypothetical protein